MLTRRSFLQSSSATTLGLLVAQRPDLDLAESGRFLAGSNSFDQVDRPRSLIHPGFNPIHPERVVVIGGNGWLPRNTGEHRLRRRLACGRKLAAGKLDTILRLMHVLTNYYRRPQLFEAWATGVANRESLGSTGLGGGFGLLPHGHSDPLARVPGGHGTQQVSFEAPWAVVQFGEGDILVCHSFAADRNVCPTNLNRPRMAFGSRPDYAESDWYFALTHADFWRHSHAIRPL